MNELLEALNFDKERGGNDGLAAYLDSTQVKNVRADINDLLTKERLAVLTSVEKMLRDNITQIDKDIKSAPDHTALIWLNAEKTAINVILTELTTLKPC
jgi:hypothetical protein